jgi:hypothetical protein
MKKRINKKSMKWINIGILAFIALVLLFLLAPYLNLSSLSLTKFSLLHDILSLLVKSNNYFFDNLMYFSIGVVCIIVFIFVYKRKIKA